MEGENEETKVDTGSWLMAYLAAAAASGHAVTGGLSTGVYSPVSHHSFVHCRSDWVSCPLLCDGG